MTKLYMAYGSNLNKGQMSVRCPTAKPVGSAMILGYELVFRGVADIQKSADPNMMIPVGIWEIEASDEAALDSYEGYPRLYGKIMVNGIMTYQMNTKRVMPPYVSYFNTILQGYQDFGLDTTYLYDAAGWATYEDMNRDDVFELESA